MNINQIKMQCIKRKHDKNTGCIVSISSSQRRLCPKDSLKDNSLYDKQIKVSGEKKTIDLSFVMSQPKFLPTKVGKLWKAINANQRQIATVCNNVNGVTILCKHAKASQTNH